MRQAVAAIRILLLLFGMLLCVMAIRHPSTAYVLTDTRKLGTVARLAYFRCDTLALFRDSVQYAHIEHVRDAEIQKVYPLHETHGIEYSEDISAPMGDDYRPFEERRGETYFLGFRYIQYSMTYFASDSYWMTGIAIPIWAVVLLASIPAITWLVRVRWNLSLNSRNGRFWGRRYVIERMLGAGIGAGALAALATMLTLNFLRPNHQHTGFLFEERVRREVIALVFLGVGFAVSCWRRHSDARWRFARPGYCFICGYDLRASKDRCPECGTGFRSGDQADTGPASFGSETYFGEG